MNLSDEMPVLLNPINDDPEDFIGYECVKCSGWFVKTFGRDDEDRGSKTRDLLGLNRNELVELRAERLNSLIFIDRCMLVALQRDNCEDSKEIPEN